MCISLYGEFKISYSFHLFVSLELVMLKFWNESSWENTYKYNSGLQCTRDVYQQCLCAVMYQVIILNFMVSGKLHRWTSRKNRYMQFLLDGLECNQTLFKVLLGYGIAWHMKAIT